MEPRSDQESMYAQPYMYMHTRASSQVKIALDKVEEATDPQRSLSKEEFVDDLALTSMDRLWDVGKTEPIKVHTYTRY